MVLTIERLPIEIQQLVFTNLGNNTKDLIQCIRVCKTWKPIYEKILYSDVVLLDYTQLAKFVDTLSNSQYLISLVKKLDFAFESKTQKCKGNSNIKKLFSLLSNLKHLSCTNGKIYFTFILEALLANHLPKLTYIEPPSWETRNYTTCAILLKDRLQNLSLNGRFDGTEETRFTGVITGVESEDEDIDEMDSFRTQLKVLKHFRRIFDQLDQFKNLQKLSISKKTDNTINFIEELIDICPTLRHLQLFIVGKDSTIASNTTMTSFTPAYHFTDLQLFENELENSQLFEYIINKFPHLQKLDVRGKIYFDESKQQFMDKELFDKLLNYLAKINTVKITNIDCKVKEPIVDSIGSFWKTMAKSRTLSVEIWYAFERLYMNLDINDSLIKNKFCYFSSMDIVEKYGCYIDHLTFFAVELETSKSSFKLLFLDPHKHCSKLKKLRLFRSTITASKSLDDQLFEKQTLDSLRLEHCILKDDIVFEKLTRLYDRIKHFELIGIEGVEDEDNNTKTRKIQMAETNLNTLTITYEAAYGEKQRQRILIKISTHEGSTYYTYDRKSMKDLLFKPISREIHDKNCYDLGKYLLIDIECRSIKNLRISYFKEEIRLTVA